MANPGTVLVAGASGLIGTAAINTFAQAGWSVVALSRARPYYAQAASHTHVALDLQDSDACIETVAALGPITHLVYTAVYELAGLMPGWSDPDQIDTNALMFTNLLKPLLNKGTLQHVTLLQGTKAYGATVRPMRVPARESQPRVVHENFYWRQEDDLVKLTQASDTTYTILRPQLVVGPNHGVAMNLVPIIGAYAAIQDHLGLPFGFPGGADWVWEAVDVRLVANAALWAAGHAGAAGQTYNLTNGEVFLWRDMWPALAQTLAVELGPDTAQSMAAYFSEHQQTWQKIAQQHQLAIQDLSLLGGKSHHYADLCFAYGQTNPPAPALVSTVKIKQAGFGETYNTEESFCFWLRYLQQHKILPAPNPGLAPTPPA